MKPQRFELVINDYSDADLADNPYSGTMRILEELIEKMKERRKIGEVLLDINGNAVGYVKIK